MHQTTNYKCQHQQKQCIEQRLKPPGCSCQGCDFNQFNLTETLIGERETLRIRVAELESDYARDLEEQKLNIITQCEATMEKQLREFEVQMGNEINSRDAQISSLNTQLAERNKRLQDAKQEIDHIKKIAKEQEKRIAKYHKKVEDTEEEYESKILVIKKDFEVRLNNELRHLEAELSSNFELQKSKIMQEMDALKCRIPEFEQKLRTMKQLMIDIEQFRVLVNKKNQEISECNARYYEQNRKFNYEIEALRQRLQEQDDQNQKITELQKKIAKKKEKINNLKNNVKIKQETITIEKPVEVEKLVEVVKYVPIEKIVREKVPPKQPIIIQECTETNQGSNELLLKIEMKKEKIVTLKSEINELQTTVNELEDLSDNLRLQLTQSNIDKEQLIQSNAKLQTYIIELEKMIELISTCKSQQ